MTFMLSTSKFSYMPRSAECLMKIQLVRAVLLKILVISVVLGGLQLDQGRAAGSAEHSKWVRESRGKNFRWSEAENVNRKEIFSLASSPAGAPFTSNGSREEVEILMAFKQSLNVSSRRYLSSWDPVDLDPCRWRGITCSQQARRVIALRLPGAGLEGRISSLLGRLQYLQLIDLSDNFFTGNIPVSLANCTNLAFLTLSNNAFTGQIPPEVGHLSQLLSLNLRTNFFLQGRIPPSLGNCSRLRSLRLDYTLTYGEIPETLGQLSHLEVFNLSSTLNNGSVPRSLGNCSLLTYFGVGNSYVVFIEGTVQPPEIAQFSSTNTQLSGTLPEELSNLKNLRSFVLFGTNIYGHLPSWMANLTSLVELTMHSNSFSGSIPKFLGELPLLWLQVYENQFSGVIPVAISNCTNLLHLDLGSLHLGGTIPGELGLLTKIYYLRVDDNLLVGKIPLSLFNCSSLQELGLGDNPMDAQRLPSPVESLVNLTTLYLPNMTLVGEIPAAIARLPNLRRLYLFSNQMNGSIPKWIGNCSTLEIFSLGFNEISGSIPSELWELRQLRVLYIYNNKLTGGLSDSVGNLSYLDDLELSTNFLTNALPSRLTELSSLSLAYLFENNFNGPIPASIGNLSALTSLDISDNDISGFLPTSIGNLTVMSDLYLNENQLNGAIPADLMRCYQLISLDLHSNMLNGKIPSEMGQLQALTELYLHHNRLSGLLPSSLGACKNLLFVDLSYNVLEGLVPAEAFGRKLEALLLLNLSHNSFYGLVPTSFGYLTAIRTLQLSANNFSGPIPSALGSCLSLETLDLSENGLSGAIPDSLGALNNLALLNVSYNHLEGALPETGIFSSGNFSAAWFLGNPGLCGSRLQRNCSALVSAAGSPCKGLGCKSRLAAVVSSSTVGLLAIVGGMYVAYWVWTRRKSVVDFKDGIVTFASNVHVSDQDLEKIIEDPANLIAVSASSSVYKANLGGGEIVAIKVLKTSSSVSEDEGDGQVHLAVQARSLMYREADTLAQLKHRNIVKVLGVFSNPKMIGLVLEYMPMGSLHKQLYDEQQCSLQWETRLEIGLGIAQGLVYLHEEVEVPIIHTDLKPSNILLDADMVPKVGDFGISKFANVGRRDGEVTASRLCGTVGYIPPEYASSTRVSTRGDVYSYGVVLLELLTRRPPDMQTTTQEVKPEDGMDPATGDDAYALNPLVDWVLKSSRSPQSSLTVVDPLLLGANDNSTKHLEQMRLLIQVGLLCTQTNPQSRPRMYDVLAMLVHIQRLGEDPVKIPTVAELAQEND